MLGLGTLGQYPLGGGPFGAASIETIGWFGPFADPVWFIREPRRAVAINNQVFAFNPLPVVPFAWFETLSEPVRSRPRAAAALYPSHFWQPAPSPFAATGWFEALSEPVRFKRALPASLHPALAYQSNPLAVTPFAWFAGLSEPVRFKRALPRALMPFFAGDPNVIPISRLIAWFEALSEPVRLKPGLSARLQQFLASPSRLLPTPAISGTMNALETKDVLLAGGRDWNRIISGEIGVSERNFSGGETGVAVSKVISAKVSIYMI